MAKIGIIGLGNIGKILMQKLKQKGGEIVFTVDIDESRNESGEKIKWPYSIILDKMRPDIVFLAIPTGKDQGTIAGKYIFQTTNQKIPIVTCEKGALSKYYSILASDDKINRLIGISATVGGGTRLLHVLRRRMNGNVEEVHLIINGTLNYIWHSLAQGLPFGQVLNQAQKLGYTEPGNTDPLSIIKGEAEGDVPKKTVIVVNHCFQSSAFMDASDIVINRPLGNADLDRLVAQAHDRRFIVSAWRKNSATIPEENDIIGGFSFHRDNWVITAGFQRLSNNRLFQRIITSGMDNAFLTVEGRRGADGIFELKGPGAGPGPTTAAMIRDAELLLEKQLHP